MSTRATYQFIDEFDDVTVYKHHDGYPEGGLQWIAKSIPYAWSLPRFEASDFGAAFVAANKLEGGGDVQLTKDRHSHADTEYHYIVRGINGVIWVVIENLWSDDIDCDEYDTLDHLLDKYAPKREWV